MQLNSVFFFHNASSPIKETLQNLSHNKIVVCKYIYFTFGRGIFSFIGPIMINKTQKKVNLSIQFLMKRGFFLWKFLCKKGNSH